MQFFTVLGIFIGIPAWLALSSLLNGWVFGVLWLWFVTPLGLPALSIGHAIGLSCFISFATYQYQEDAIKEKSSDAERWGRIVGVSLIRPLMTIAFAWCIHTFF